MIDLPVLAALPTPTPGGWIVLTGAATNVACALVGCYLVLRRMSMMGDALSHAVLPGLVVAFLFSGSMAIVPSIHLAVIRLDQILSDLQELYALLRWDEKEWESGLTNYMSFISGPSKTADIEATMVHGAHGPREVHIFVIT